MTDRRFMERAIELAGRGRGWTNPNPLVGAVIVKNGKVIGEGYHARYGEMHAERNALAALTEPAEGAVLYVTLEPCCHYGKTPPCTEAILEHKIARVVIGSRDPNPKVAGKGAAILRAAGVQVEEDFMREECDRLNPVFFHYITTGRPYVVMKYAMTADGKIATHTGASQWITGEAARKKVQEFRWTYSGIMAGIGTVLADDPLLTVREAGKRSPVRIICDSRLQLPLDSNICRTAKEYPTVAACTVGAEDSYFSEKWKQLEEAGVHVISVPDGEGRVDLQQLMERLGAGEIPGIGKIDSILLEGGGTLNESGLRAGIVREVKAFVAPKIFGGGGKSPVEGIGVKLPSEAQMLKLENVTQIGEDLLLEYKTAEGGQSCLQASWKNRE